jgi:DeoR/GlpR family transcriptional regulator of sugar metabolism
MILVTTFERRQQILDILRKQPGLRVPELARLLNVSEGTIRNDLNALDDTGQVIRVRGGAAVSDDIRLQSPSFLTRSRKDYAAKQAIAARAAELVSDGDSILLDASSTVYALAEMLRERSRLRVITNGIEAARALAQNPTNNVILLGGTLNLDGSAISGTLSEQFIQNLHIQTAFLSASGFTPAAGLTEVHVDEAQLKMRMIQAADRVIALVDSSKFGKVDLIAFAQASQITHLYTDQAIEGRWIDALKEAGVSFSVCGKTSAEDYSPESH